MDHAPIRINFISRFIGIQVRPLKTAFGLFAISSFLILVVLLNLQSSSQSEWTVIKLLTFSKTSRTQRFMKYTSSSVSSMPNFSPSNNSYNKTNMACVFPDQDPFHESIVPHFIRYPTVNCSDGKPNFVYLDGNFLRLNKTKTVKYNVKIIQCTFTTITMKNGSDMSIEESKPSAPFTDAVEIQSIHDNIVVSCENEKKTVFKTYISVIRVKKEKEIFHESNYKRHMKTNYPKETLSVLLLGIDATSRQNFIRSMPKTRNFILDKLNALELEKFNKVGDNTFPNIAALTAGMSEDELLQRWTYKTPLETIDHLFLWHHYKNAGYRTAMLLDHLYITAFHYLKKGWPISPPFDYYHRSMVIKLAIESWGNTTHCVGDTPEVTFLLDYYLQLATTFNNTITNPYFAYGFLVKLTHDYPNVATSVDQLYYEFFQELTRRNVLNNTLLVFFSDHGSRFGTIRATAQGTMECKTPFMFFMFPPWFKKKYPDVMKTFRTNQHRLTTHYDVHATLKDLLNFKGETGKGNLQTQGISLFNEIPANRTCLHASIPLEFCMCTQVSSNQKLSKEVTDELVTALEKHIVDKTSMYRKQCKILKLATVKSAFVTRSKTECKECAYFLVTIEVNPGAGIFEATVQFDKTSDTLQVVGSATRLNMYKGQAECIDDLKMRPYCFCNSLSNSTVIHV